MTDARASRSSCVGAAGPAQARAREIHGQMTIEECIAEAVAVEAYSEFVPRHIIGLESEEDAERRAFAEKLAHWRINGVPLVLPSSFRACP